MIRRQKPDEKRRFGTMSEISIGLRKWPMQP
jgi:hypothetical protein